MSGLLLAEPLYHRRTTVGSARCGDVAPELGGMFPRAASAPFALSRLPSPKNKRRNSAPSVHLPLLLPDRERILDTSQTHRMVEWCIREESERARFQALLPGQVCRSNGVLAKDASIFSQPERRKAERKAGRGLLPSMTF